jgi:ketosteroid isomerase-like protein
MTRREKEPIMSTQPNVTEHTTETAPEVVTRYLEAADRGDIRALAASFTPDGTVVDEGVTYRGRDEIIGWREQLDSKWVYTSTVTGSRAVDDHTFLIGVLVEGNFPGGRADLTYSFSVDGDLLTALTIVE